MLVSIFYFIIFDRFKLQTGKIKTVAAAKALGKTKGVLLAHTHSNEVMERKFGQSSEESVGYAAIVY